MKCYSFFAFNIILLLILLNACEIHNEKRAILDSYSVFTWGSADSETCVEALEDRSGNIVFAANRSVPFYGESQHRQELKSPPEIDEAFLVKADTEMHMIWELRLPDTIFPPVQLNLSGYMRGCCISSLVLDLDDSILISGRIFNYLNVGDTWERESTGAYLARFAPDSKLVWHLILEEDQAEVTDIDVDSEGNIYASGSYFVSTSTLPEFPEFIGYTRSFIRKYNQDGSLIDKIEWGEDEVTNAFQMELATEDSIFVRGNFTGTVDFNPEGQPDVRKAAPYHNYYIMSFNELLEINWVITWQDINQSQRGELYVKDIESDQQGHLWVTGNYGGRVDLDPSNGLDIRDAGDGTDIFISRYASNGYYELSEVIAGPGTDVSVKIVANANQCYVIGYSLPGHAIASSSSEPFDMPFMWMIRPGSDPTEMYSFQNVSVEYGIPIISSAVLCDQGKMILGGEFYQSVDFDLSPDGTRLINSNGSGDIYIIRISELPNR